MGYYTLGERPTLKHLRKYGAGLLALAVIMSIVPRSTFLFLILIVALIALVLSAVLVARRVNANGQARTAQDRRRESRMIHVIAGCIVGDAVMIFLHKSGIAVIAVACLVILVFVYIITQSLTGGRTPAKK